MDISEDIYNASLVHRWKLCFGHVNLYVRAKKKKQNKKKTLFILWNHCFLSFIFLMDVLILLDFDDFLLVKHKWVETLARINSFPVPKSCPLELMPSCWNWIQNHSLWWRCYSWRQNKLGPDERKWMPTWTGQSIQSISFPQLFTHTCK